MKVSCLQENLNWALGIVCRGLSRLKTESSKVIIETVGNNLILRTASSEMSIRCRISAKVVVSGMVVMSAQLLAGLVGILPKDRIDIDVIAGRTIITCARFTANFNSLKSDLPSYTWLESGISTGIDVSDLRTALNRVTFAAGDESRPLLSGINLLLKDKTATFAAVDGFRLAVMELPLKVAVKQVVNIVIPAKSLDIFNQCIADRSGVVKLIVNLETKQVFLRAENIEMVTQTIPGRYPNYGSLIPAKFATIVEVNRVELLRSLRAVSSFTRETGTVRFFITKTSGDQGELTITAKSKDEERDTSKHDIVVTVDGVDAKIAFKPNYIISALSKLNSERVSLSLNTPTSPGVIHPVDGDNYTYVVMPMFVAW